MGEYGGEKSDNRPDDIEELIDIEVLKGIFEKFSDLTGYTTGFVKQDTREVLISTGWKDICKKYHRGTPSSESICKISNKNLTDALHELQQVAFHKCQHGMIDGATPIIIDGKHLADLFSGQVLFDEPHRESFKLRAHQFGYDVEGYLDALGEVKITSEEKLNEVLGFLSEIAKIIAQIGKEKKEVIELNRTLEDKVLEKTEEQNTLLSLFDEGDSVLFKWNNDREWSAEYASVSVEALTGYTNREFMMKKITYLQCVHEDDMGRVVQESCDSLLSESEYFRHKPYRIITKSGEVKWVLDNTVKVKNSAGETSHFIGYISDITELKRLEINLEEQVKIKTDQNIKQLHLLQQQSKMASMGEMVGMIAHQWRQPLNVIMSSIQNLEYDYAEGLIDRAFIAQFIEKQKNIIRFMSDTIDDFRGFFRVDKKKSAFNVLKATQSVVDMQLTQLQEHKIEVTVEGDEFTYVGFRSEYQQVVLNIVNNAKDALIERDVKDPKIDILLQDNCVFIKDNAGGIPCEILDNIFDLYFTTKRHGKGTGMGLYMSKMIIHNSMGAILDVENVGEGTQFCINFKGVGRNV
jgi:PAS domain S-box-containing protein